MLTFTDTNRSFELDGDLSETMTNYKFIVDHSNPQEKKHFLSLGNKWNLILTRKDEKVLEISLFWIYLIHPQSWLLEFQRQYFHHLIQTNFAED